MKHQSRDPFEVAYEDDSLDQESPIDSPVAATDDDIVVGTSSNAGDGFAMNNVSNSSSDNNVSMNKPSSSGSTPMATTTTLEKNKDDDDDEEDDTMEIDLGKYTAGGDPDKLVKMQAILSQFTEEQMSRYESFRRSGFQKGNMKKLLASLTGTPKISQPVNIVVSGIAKMFVGDLVETARMVMNERNDSGPIRPCHIRESYRRLKLEGKLPKQSVPRLFR
ncbi:hypothetical protein ACHQM5_017246 [Ranunculus cassubicifolius]